MNRANPADFHENRRGAAFDGAGLRTGAVDGGREGTGDGVASKVNRRVSVMLHTTLDAGGAVAPSVQDKAHSTGSSFFPLHTA